jgi:hypothetical protein
VAPLFWTFKPILSEGLVQPSVDNHKTMGAMRRIIYIMTTNQGSFFSGF